MKKLIFTTLLFSLVSVSQARYFNIVEDCLVDASKVIDVSEGSESAAENACSNHCEKYEEADGSQCASKTVNTSTEICFCEG